MDTSEQILTFIKQNGKSTPKQLTDTLKISKRTLMRYLSDLLAQDKIDKTGTPPKVHYFLKESPKPKTTTTSADNPAEGPAVGGTGGATGPVVGPAGQTASHGNGTINRLETTTSVNAKLEELTAIMVDVCIEIINLGKEVEKIHSLLQPVAQPAQAPTVPSQVAPPPKVPATPAPPSSKVTPFMMLVGLLILVGGLVLFGYLVYLIFNWLVAAVITIYDFVVHLR